MRILEGIRAVIDTLNKLESQAISVGGLAIGYALVQFGHANEGREVLMASFAMLQHKTQQ